MQTIQLSAAAAAADSLNYSYNAAIFSQLEVLILHENRSRGRRRCEQEYEGGVAPALVPSPTHWSASSSLSFSLSGTLLELCILHPTLAVL
jgi:hypothetical protein